MEMETEQAYIAALAKRYTDAMDIDPKKPNIDYKDAMQARRTDDQEHADGGRLFARRHIGSCLIHVPAAQR